MKKDLTVIGLTGGIASGKSTVAGFLREAGVPVIDADGLGHMALAEDGEAYAPVVEAFGADILGEGGQIDRQKLGAKVFDDPKRRAELEAIVHPVIGRLSKRGFEMIAERGEPMAFYEAALLVETGMYKALDGLVVVTCSIAAQMDRLVSRDGFTREAAAARIASQYPLEEKLAVADYIIENDGPLDETREATLGVLLELKKRFRH